MLKIIRDDFKLVLHALKNPPSLIIDAGNSANPHKFYPYVPYENYKQTYVVAVDAIYRFRDTLKNTGEMANALGAKLIVITSFDYLFNYQDEAENRNVMEHVQELIAGLGKSHDLYVNMKEGFVRVF